jgi:hypothetical protein
MSSIYEFNSGQVTYTTVGFTGSTGPSIPIVITGPAQLAANNMVVYPGGGFIDKVDYDAILANVNSSPTPTFTLELYAEFKGTFSVVEYPTVATDDLYLGINFGKFGRFQVPMYCYSATASVAYFNATSIMCFDVYDDTLPSDTTVAYVYNRSTGITNPVFYAVMSFRINYRSQ